MAYVRHELIVTDPNVDGTMRIVVSINSADGEFLTQTQLDDAVSAMADSIDLITDKSVTTTRVDETGTVL